MFAQILRIVLAAAISFAAVWWATNGAPARMGEIVREAGDYAAEGKADRIANRAAGAELAAESVARAAAETLLKAEAASTAANEALAAARAGVRSESTGLQDLTAAMAAAEAARKAAAEAAAAVDRVKAAAEALAAVNPEVAALARAAGLETLSGVGHRNAPRAPAPVVAAEIRAEPVERKINLTGRTEAVRRIEIRAETSGRVTASPVRQGQRVSAGELVCRIEAGDRPARRAQAESNLRQAQANFDSLNQLAQRGFAPRNRVLESQAAMDSAHAALRQIDEEMGRLDLRAPSAGLIDQSPAEQGSILSAGGLCATVVELDPIRAVGYVREGEVADLRVGARASIALPGGRKVEGTVRYVAAAADAATRTFEVSAEFPNRDYAVRDGLTAEISIPLSSASGHKLPQSALTLDSAGRLGVMTVEGSTARFVPATILRDTTEGVWVDGLPERARVVTVGQNFISDGAAVRAVTPEELKALEAQGVGPAAVAAQGKGL